MHTIARRFLNVLAFIGLSIFVSLAAATVVALRHIIETPQPLESILPGDARIYRWRRGHIFYKVLGDENAPPLVLLHAPVIGASAYEMRKIIGALAQKYHVYAPDLLGFGLSDHPQIDYSADTYVSLCHDFLIDVVAEPATLLASGLSSNYAVIVAKRFPTLCARLVLISPSELSGNEQPTLVQRACSKLAEKPTAGFLLYPMLSTRTALRIVMTRRHSPHHGQISASDVDYLYATTHQFGAEHAVVAQLAGRLAVSVVEDFDALHQPTLIIWGARALNNTRSIKSHQDMPEKTELALIQDAGIYVHEEYPALVVANILEWSEVDKVAVAATVEKAAKEVAFPTAEAATEIEKPAVEEPVVKDEGSNDNVLSPRTEAEKTQQSATSETLLAYCARCKKKTPMRDVQEVIMKNGNPAVKGKCSICGTGQHRIGRL